MSAKILIIDDDIDMQKLLSDLLGSEKYHVELASSAGEALEKMSETVFDLIISDLCMPPGMNGIELLKKIREMNIDSVVIFITAYGSVKTAVEAMKSGAIYYIEKPFDYEQLKNLAFQTLNERWFRRSITENKLLAYTLKRAVFNTEKITVNKQENLLPA